MPNNRFNKRGTGKTPVPENLSSEQCLGRIQPQAVEIEMSVLGAVMLDKNAYSRVSRILETEHFYDTKHQIIYDAVKLLGERQQAIDMLTVTRLLEQQHQLESIGGNYYIAKLTSIVTNAANIEYHARIIKHCWLKRQLLSISGKMEASAFDETTEADQIIEEAYSELAKITNGSSVIEQGIGKSFAAAVLQVEQKAVVNYDWMPLLNTGFRTLDDYIGELHGGALYVVGAHPGMGKTVFLLNMVKSQLGRYRKVLFYSTDKTKMDITNILLSDISDVEISKFVKGVLTKEEWMKIANSEPVFRDLPLLLVDSKQYNPTTINVIRLIRRAHSLGAEIAYIDCLQGIDPWDKSSEYERLTALMNRLKLLAMELDIPIVISSTLNRRYTEYRREGIRPELRDLAGSGAIESVSSTVMFIYRPEYYRIYEDDYGNDLRGTADIIIAKNNYGSVGEVRLKYKASVCRYSEECDEVPDFSMLPAIEELQKKKDDVSKQEGDAPF